MYEAGAAAVLLTGRVDENPFAHWGRLFESAKVKSREGITVRLTAKDDAAGPLTRFRELLLGTQTAARETAASVDKSFATMDAAASDSAVAAERSAGIIRRSYASIVAGAREAAAASKIAYAEMGGGGRGGGAAVGGVASGPEEQAKRTAKAWKEGFSTMATMGKWVTVGVLGVGAVSLKAASDFQKQMELVHTQAGYSQQEVDKLKKSVLDLAPAVGVGPTKLAQGLFHIASSGIPAAKAMEVLRLAAEGAKVGNADMEAVTNALVAIMRTAPKDIHGVSEAMGVLNDIVGRGNLRMQDLVGALSTGILPAAKAVGLGLRDVGAALDVMTSRGVPAQEGATRLRTVLGLIANPTSKAQKALDELGFAHDRLALDFRKKGLVGALQDLQNAMSKTFGHKLTADEERQALLNYANQLKDAGVSGNAAQKDLMLFRRELEKNGEGAIKSSQLIAEAFGGARMGTTMQILMQNIDDVRKHFDTLNKAGAAQRFQSSWKATEKNFSEQAAQMWAGIQKLGIQIGTYLIPKVEALVHWLSEAGKWLGRHKALAEALAITFGTLLTAAVVAFFARFVARTAQGIASIGRFGKAIYDIPKTLEQVSGRVADQLDAQRAEWLALEEQVISTTGAIEAEGGAATGAAGIRGGAGGVGALGAEAAGMIEGMITGVFGTAAPGSKMNPLAVVVLAGEQFGLGGGTGVAREGQVAAGGGGRGVARPAGAPDSAIPGGRGTGITGTGPNYINPTRNLAAEEQAIQHEVRIGEQAVRGEASILSGLGGAVRKSGTVLSSLLGKAGFAGMGVLMAQSIGSMFHGAMSTAIKDIGTGAAIGSMFGPWGTALGAALGGALALFTSHGKSDGEKWAEQFTSTLPGHISDATKKGLKQAADTPIPRSPAPSPGAGSPIPSVAVSFQAVEQARINARAHPGAETTKELNVALGFYRHEFDKQFNAMFNAAFTFGDRVGKNFVEGMQKVKFPSEVALLGQIQATLNNVPKNVKAAGSEAVAVWRNQAIRHMVEYATTLEKEGKLPRGAVDRLIASLEVKFHGLTAYLDKSGMSSEKIIERHMKFEGAQKNLANALDKFRTEWDFTWQFSKTTNKNIFQNAATTMEDLRTLMHSKSKLIRDEASALFHQMQQNISKTFTAMLGDTDANLQKLSAQMAAHIPGATQQASQDFVDFQANVRLAMLNGVLSTAEGSRLINKALNAALKAFGAQPVDVNIQLVEAQAKGLQVGSTGPGGQFHLHGGGGATPKRAGGGPLPGGEFGHGDHMTLVDPTGKPRARMAGDEWVFSKHQAPYVEAGLQAIGFGGAQDLWSTITRPHGYATGGALNPQGHMRVPGGAPKGQYIYPFVAGTTIGRTDQGIDATMPVGSPIGPIGRARIEGIQSNWYAGQPYVWWSLLEGPKKGTMFYVAEQITGIAQPGQIVEANEPVATYRSSGTAIEYGFAAPGGNTLAQAQGNTGSADHSNAPAGVQFRKFLLGLAHGKILGGGAVGSAPVPTLHPPRAIGKGTMPTMVRAALHKATGAANAYLQAHASNAAGASGAVFTGSFKARPGGWYRVGATVDTASQYGYTEAQFQAHQGSPSNYNAGMSFAELLEAGPNAGMRPDITELLGLPRGNYGMPYGTQVDFRMPGGKRAATGTKSDVGSGQPGNAHFKADVHQRLGQAIGWHPNQDLEVKHHARGGALAANMPHRKPTRRELAELGMLPIDAHGGGWGEPISVNPPSHKEISRFNRMVAGAWNRLSSNRVLPAIARRPPWKIHPTNLNELFTLLTLPGAQFSRMMSFPWEAVHALLHDNPNHYLRKYVEQGIVHEMAHTMQGYRDSSNQMNVEGGAQSWAESHSPIHERLSAYDTMGWVAHTKRVKGWNWIDHLQFQKNARFAGGGALAGDYARGGGPRPHRKLYSVSTGGHHAPKQTKRGKQPLPSKVAQYLKSIGLGDLATDQRLLGALDDRYTRQSNIYGLYQGTSTSLPLDELDTLQGIREQEWNILWHEYQVLPEAIAYLKGHISQLTGTAPGKGWSTKVVDTPVGPHSHHKRGTGGGSEGSGILGLNAEIVEEEGKITSLDNELRRDEQKVGRRRHAISQQALTLATNYASSLAGYHDELNAITEARGTLSDQRLRLQHSKTKGTTGGSGQWDPSTLVGHVLAGNTGPLPNPTTGRNNRIDDAIYILRKRDAKLRTRATTVRVAMQGVLRKKQAAALKLRKEGFDAAWALQLQRWHIGDKVAKLRQSIKRLKQKLKREEAALAEYGATFDPTTGKVSTTVGGTLDTLETWLNGNDQGQQSVLQSLGDIGYDLLDLHTQGADLPTPISYSAGKPGPTVDAVTAILAKLGVALPAGLVQGGSAADAYAMFQAFQTDRSTLFSQFGGNFVGAGINPFATPAGIGAGTQYFGAAAGPSPGYGAMAGGGPLFIPAAPPSPAPQSPGATTYHLENHFMSGPPDPHTWAAGTLYEIQGQV